MKIKSFGILLCTCIIVVSACKISTKKEIVFLNDLKITGRAAVTWSTNTFESSYVKNDEDTVYAFILSYEYCVDGDNMGLVDGLVEPTFENSYENNIAKREYRVQKALKMLSEVGLAVLCDYPFCYYNNEDNTKYILGECAFLGTYEQVEQLFDGTEPVNGVCWRVCCAPRPDLLKKIEGLGFDESWLNWDLDKLRDVLGDKNQVTMKVNFETAED